MLQTLQKKKIVDEVLLIPNYRNPIEKKTHYLPSEMRWKILQRVFDKQKKYTLWNYELRQKRAVPSIETLRILQKKFYFKKFYWIMGADTFAKISEWQESKDFQRRADFIVFPRAKNPAPTPPKTSKIIFFNEPISDIHSTHLRAATQNYESYSQDLRTHFLSSP
jgi:nicotinate (nicotinamide) nucleotide adenylyltransferase